MQGPGFPVYSPADNGGIPRQPTREQVVSIYTQNAVEVMQQQSFLMTAVAMVVVIFLLQRFAK